mgnify:CR=1 FL=1
MTGIDLFEQAMMLSGLELEDAEALKPFALGCINQLLRDRAYEQQRLTAHAEICTHGAFRMDWRRCSWKKMITANAIG